MKFLVALALCFVAVLAGEVDHRRCGGVGTLHYIGIEGCEGQTCVMIPGRAYNCEGHMTPSSNSPSLSLKVSTQYFGITIIIMDVELVNSPVQGGTPYTVRFTITPNDILQGNTLPISAEVRHTEGGLVEVCGIVQVEVSQW